MALDPYDVEGKIMINIDSESEGVFTVGCAGGARIDITLPMEKKEIPEAAVKVSVGGLKGGHSGVEINKGRHNAIKILADLLGSVEDPISVGALKGGNADNAIPRSAECLINASANGAIEKAIPRIIEKYIELEPSISVLVEGSEDAILFSEDATKNIISLINEEPSGVIKMSEDIPTLVETSLNLGILASDSECVRISFSVRSAKGEEKTKLATRVTKIAEDHGATHHMHGEYPAWEYRRDSHLRDVMCDVYKRMYGKDAEVIIIHAGLECGIFSDKIAGLDCVSFGPDMYDIHTTEERLSISSTARVWSYLLKVLKNI